MDCTRHHIQTGLTLLYFCVLYTHCNLYAQSNGIVVEHSPANLHVVGLNPARCLCLCDFFTLNRCSLDICHICDQRPEAKQLNLYWLYQIDLEAHLTIFTSQISMLRLLSLWTCHTETFWSSYKAKQSVNVVMILTRI